MTTTAIVEQPPFILVKPKLTVGPAGSEVEFECGANQVEAAPEVDENTTETFCGTFTSYKPEVWTITITALTSYGADGLWNLLRPFAGTRQPFTLLPDISKPIGPDNPEMSGECIVKPFAFLSAAVGETSDFDLVLAVQGIPVFDETPGATGLAAPAPSSAPSSGE